jgi:hypothetical protein
VFIPTGYHSELPRNQPHRVFAQYGVDEKFERCYQLMETDDRRLLDEWLANWSDLVDFEVYPVMTSTEAAERIAPRL